MINETETKNKFGYISNDIGKFSQKILVCNCDICGTEFEKSSFKLFCSRKNSKSEIDLCKNIECIKKKRENTMLKKYGVINAGLSFELRKKVENTCLKKYGTKNPMDNTLDVPKDFERLGFRDGENFVAYTPHPADIKIKLTQLLSDPERLDHIASSGFNFVRGFHTNEIRAERFWTFLRGLL